MSDAPGGLLISMSLYGEGEMYLAGALANARLAPRIYPGWRLRVYVENRTPARALREAGAEVVRMGLSRDHSGMMWRFLPAYERGWRAVIFRDADSRLNAREAAAVAEWLAGPERAHCMHDHPHHASLPLFGGMWGIKGPQPLKKGWRLHSLISHGAAVPRGGDMRWLTANVLPQVARSLLRHSSVQVPWPGARPFPDHLPLHGFVGQQHDAAGRPIWP